MNSATSSKLLLLIGLCAIPALGSLGRASSAAIVGASKASPAVGSRTNASVAAVAKAATQISELTPPTSLVAEVKALRLVSDAAALDMARDVYAFSTLRALALSRRERVNATALATRAYALHAGDTQSLSKRSTALLEGAISSSPAQADVAALLWPAHAIMQLYPTVPDWRIDYYFRKVDHKSPVSEMDGLIERAGWRDSDEHFFAKMFFAQGPSSDLGFPEITLEQRKSWHAPDDDSAKTTALREAFDLSVNTGRHVLVEYRDAAASLIDELETKYVEPTEVLSAHLEETDDIIGKFDRTLKQKTLSRNDVAGLYRAYVNLFDNRGLKSDFLLPNLPLRNSAIVFTSTSENWRYADAYLWLRDVLPFMFGADQSAGVPVRVVETPHPYKSFDGARRAPRKFVVHDATHLQSLYNDALRGASSARREMLEERLRTMERIDALPEGPDKIAAQTVYTHRWWEGLEPEDVAPRLSSAVERRGTKVLESIAPGAF